MYLAEGMLEISSLLSVTCLWTLLKMSDIRGRVPLTVLEEKYQSSHQVITKWPELTD